MGLQTIDAANETPGPGGPRHPWRQKVAAESGGTAVAVQNLGKRYGHVAALTGVTFALSYGELLSVVGPDGSGKTTLIQLLAGLLEPSEGTAIIAGLNIRSAGTTLGERIGFMSEGFSLYGTLTVAENLAFFADLYGVVGPQRAKRIAELVRFSQLDEALNRRASQLSGGMQKKLALCCVLIHRPKILLLDEPTLGVDPLSRQEFWRLLEHFMTEGIAIVSTTAYLDEAERGQHVLLLHEGQVLAAGAPDQLTASSPERVWVIRNLAPATRPILEATFGVERVSVAPQLTRLRLPASDTSPVDRLGEIGITADVALAQPTLEDVFVAHVAAKEHTIEQPVSRTPSDRPMAATPNKHAGIRVDGLTRRFGEFTAVDRVSLEIGSGGIFGLVGPNGSGKSTLIRMLIGLLEPSAGSARIAGHDISQSGGALRNEIGYMSQRFSLYLDLTVAENLSFFGGVYGLRGRDLANRMAWAVQLAGLVGYERVRTHDLGGGYRQRLALAAALLHRPHVLFLDEPTAGVDPLARRRFWNLIYAVAATGTTIFATTHHLEEVERCEQVGLLDRGRLIAVGTPDYLKQAAQTTVGAALYSVTTDAPIRTLELLSSRSDVAQATIQGPRVRVTLATTGDLAQLSSDLQSAGITATFQPTEPTMEDAFVALVQQARSVGT